MTRDVIQVGVTFCTWTLPFAVGNVTTVSLLAKYSCFLLVESLWMTRDVTQCGITFSFEGEYLKGRKAYFHGGIVTHE